MIQRSLDGGTLVRHRHRKSGGDSGQAAICVRLSEVLSSAIDDRCGLKEASSIEICLNDGAWGNEAESVDTLTEATASHQHGFVVLPDPTLAGVQQAARSGAIRSFYRWSCPCFLDAARLMAAVKILRRQSSAQISLRLDASDSREAELAQRWCDQAGIELLTPDLDY